MKVESTYIELEPDDLSVMAAIPVPGSSAPPEHKVAFTISAVTPYILSVAMARDFGNQLLELARMVDEANREQTEHEEKKSEEEE